MVSVVCPLCGGSYHTETSQRTRRALRHHLMQHAATRHPLLGDRERSLLADLAVEGVR